MKVEKQGSGRPLGLAITTQYGTEHSSQLGEAPMLGVPFREFVPLPRTLGSEQALRIRWERGTVHEPVAVFLRPARCTAQACLFLCIPVVALVLVSTPAPLWDVQLWTLKLGNFCSRRGIFFGSNWPSDLDS